MRFRASWGFRCNQRIRSPGLVLRIVSYCLNLSYAFATADRRHLQALTVEESPGGG